MEDLIRGVGALEGDMKDVKVTLSRVESTLARIDERLAGMVTRTELAESIRPLTERMSAIEGKVSQLPTTWQMIVAILGAFIPLTIAMLAAVTALWSRMGDILQAL